MTTTLTLRLTLDEARMLASAAGHALDCREVAATFFPDEAERSAGYFALAKLHTAITRASFALGASVYVARPR